MPPCACKGTHVRIPNVLYIISVKFIIEISAGSARKKQSCLFINLSVAFWNSTKEVAILEYFKIFEVNILLVIPSSTSYTF